MPLGQVIIDDATWEAGSGPRRIEWESNIRELLEPSTLRFREDADAMHVAMGTQAFTLRATDGDGGTLAEVELPHEDLADQIAEYVDIVRQIGTAQEAGGLNRLEALDMAKKVTHDRVGRHLKRRCRELGIDHATARRLFTLLLSLRVDTTRLMGVHGHRRIR